MTKVKKSCTKCHREFSTFALKERDIPTELANLDEEIKAHQKDHRKRNVTE